MDKPSRWVLRLPQVLGVTDKARICTPCIDLQRELGNPKLGLAMVASFMFTLRVEGAPLFYAKLNS